MPITHFPLSPTPYYFKNLKKKTTFCKPKSSLQSKALCKISGILSTIKGLSSLKEDFAEGFWGCELLGRVQNVYREISLQKAARVLQTAETLVIVKCLLRCRELLEKGLLGFQLPSPAKESPLLRPLCLAWWVRAPGPHVRALCK